MDYGRYPAVSLRMYPSAGRRIGRIGRRRPHLRHRLFTSTDIGIRWHCAWYTVAV